NARCKAKGVLTNVQVVVLNEVAQEANLTAAGDVEGKELHVAFNIVDKPEIRNTNDFKIEEGEFVRAFRLADLVGLPVLVGHGVLADDLADVAKGDILVAEADTGNWVKGSDATNAIQLEVVEKNMFADGGVEAIVRVSDAGVTP